MNLNNICAYYRLTKPGIIYGNTIVAIAAYVFGANQHIALVPFLGLLVGLMASIASVCVVNNVLDRDIDARMERTKNRAIPTGTISARNAYLFAFVLFVIGTGSLYFFTNLLTLVLTLIADAVYVLIYTPLKRVSHHSTIVGTVAGSMPPLIGYTTATHSLDLVALSLFIFMVAWQMVHFMGIAIFRKSEYAAADVPVLSVRFPGAYAKTIMVTYAVLCVVSAGVFAYVALLPLYLSLLLMGGNILWGLYALLGSRTHDDVRWARKVFGYSMLILLLLCAVLVLA